MSVVQASEDDIVSGNEPTHKISVTSQGRLKRSIVHLYLLSRHSLPASMLLGPIIILAFAARSIASYTIQDEGQACYDMAAAMPGLTRITGT